jgi:hypothetical protein
MAKRTKKSTEEAAAPTKPAKKVKATSSEKEEASTTPISRKPLWIKKTRGKLYPLPHKRKVFVKHRQTIELSEEEIGRWRDHFDLVKDGTGKYKVKEPVLIVTETKSGKAKKKEPETNTDEDVTYDLVPVGEGLFNVESSAGKVMNDSPLNQDDAEVLQASLNEANEEDND